MRPEINKLKEMGPFPAGTIDTDPEIVEAYQVLIDSIEPPVSDLEAKQLMTLFGFDDFFTLAWSLVHLIQTAPGWPIKECLEDTSNEWIRRLKSYAENAGML